MMIRHPGRAVLGVVATRRNIFGRPRPDEQRKPVVQRRDVVFTEEHPAELFPESSALGVRVAPGVAQQPSALGFYVEETGDDVGDHNPSVPFSHHLRIGNCTVHAHVVGVGIVDGGHVVLCGTEQFDVSERLAFQAEDVRTRVVAFELDAQVSAPLVGGPVVMPRPSQVRAVHPLGNHLGIGIRICEAKTVRLREYRQRWRRNRADLVRHVSQLSCHEGTHSTPESIVAEPVSVNMTNASYDSVDGNAVANGSANDATSAGGWLSRNAGRHRLIGQPNFPQRC